MVESLPVFVDLHDLAAVAGTGQYDAVVAVHIDAGGRFGQFDFAHYVAIGSLDLIDDARPGRIAGGNVEHQFRNLVQLLRRRQVGHLQGLVLRLLIVRLLVVGNIGIVLIRCVVAIGIVSVRADVAVWVIGIGAVYAWTISTRAARAAGTTRATTRSTWSASRPTWSATRPARSAARSGYSSRARPRSATRTLSVTRSVTRTLSVRTGARLCIFTLTVLARALTVAVA